MGGRLATNETGNRYGKLEVLYRDEKSKGETHARWICKCDCGKEYSVSGGNLRNGLTTKCKNCVRLEYGESNFRHLYYKYKANSKTYNRVFELTETEFRTLTKSNCFYCGLEPSQVSSRHDRCYGVYIYNGIDRKDSSKGYTSDNCVACCKLCNRAKSDMDYEEYIAYLNRLCEYRKEV